MSTAIPDSDQLQSLADAALRIADIQSAVIFVRSAEPGELELAAAAGVEGPPLDRLVEAVRNPDHPIARTASQGRSEFDVTPMAPGGPTLRSHIPFMRPSRPEVAAGVLAVAHEKSLNADARRALEDLAAQAALT